jgi:hypothetical protein
VGGLTGIWTWALNEWNRRPRLSLEIRSDPGWSYIQLSRGGDHAILTALITNLSSTPNAVLKYELASRRRDSDQFDWFGVEHGEMRFEDDGQNPVVREIGVVPLNLPPRTASTSHLWVAIRAADLSRPDGVRFEGH